MFRLSFIFMLFTIFMSSAVLFGQAAKTPSLWDAALERNKERLASWRSKHSSTKSTVTRTASRARCNIRGNYNWKSSSPQLTRELCKMTRKLGGITVTGRSNCRTVKGNRGAKRSYHLYNRGCKAADLRFNNGGNAKGINYWRARRLGGTGTYHCRNFIHLDVGPVRQWHWKTRCKRRG